ncbi:MAG TPA: helix-turn-helix transcriptional regulator [Tepidisphaeraceae bacterium]|jgi:DNA-binding CsgD family transcriptional regulator|nr:helix-turn-helix transcriptional regulator [Tepidisphaeraceae bacterium]
MFRFDLVREADMAALLRLVGEVTELPADKVIRRTHVLTELLKLVGGRSAAAMEMALPGEGPLARPGTIININTSCETEARYSELFLVHNDPADPALTEFLAARGQTITMVRHVQDREYYRSAHYDIVRRPFDIDHSLYCRLTLPDGNDMSIGVQRAHGDPEFSERDKAIVHLLHTNAPHVYYAPATARVELEALAPRLQPVLRYLLQGDAEKEVAAKLKLSRHTVHRYTQAIYKELGVHSRGELLAKYVRWT